MINVVTIDDNKVDLDRINLILYQIKEVNLVRTFLNAYKAKDFLMKNRVDLIFSDIEIKNINGINKILFLLKTFIGVFIPFHQLIIFFKIIKNEKFKFSEFFLLFRLCYNVGMLQRIEIIKKSI